MTRTALARAVGTTPQALDRHQVDLMWGRSPAEEASHPEQCVLAAMSMAPSAIVAHGGIPAMISDVDAERLAADPSCSPETLTACAADVRYFVRLAVASNPSTPMEVIDMLAIDAEPVVVEAAAVNAARGDSTAIAVSINAAVWAKTERARLDDTWETRVRAAAKSNFYDPAPELFADVDDYLNGLLGPHTTSQTRLETRTMLIAAITDAFTADTKVEQRRTVVS